MVKLSLDTNRDALDDLEEAMQLLQEAIARRKATDAIPDVEATPAPKEETPAEPEAAEEAAISTPFMKITVESEDTLGEEPTLNELISNEPITEGELTEMFEKHGTKADDPPPEQPEEKKDDEFIEIVDYDEDDP